MSSSESPAVTIAIPVYERTDRLGEALDSAVNQTGLDGPVEVLVVDDASKADVRGFVQRQPGAEQVRFVRNERNLGLCGNWNRCLELATAPIVSVLHSDEVLDPTAVARVLGAFGRSPELGVVCSGRGADGTLQPAGSSAVREVMKGVQPVSSVFVRNSVIEELGAYDPRYPYFPDLELYPRIASKYAVLFLNDPPIATAATHSKHHMFSTWEKDDFLERFEAVRRVGYNFAGDAPDEADRQAAADTAYACRHIMWKSWRGGRSSLARRYYRHATRTGVLRPERGEVLLYCASAVPFGARAGLGLLAVRRLLAGLSRGNSS